MEAATWFEDIPVLGTLPREQAITKLRELGEDAAADTLEQARPAAFSWSLSSLLRTDPRAHLYVANAHAFGHIAPAPPTAEILPIKHAGNIEPDATLQNARITVTLNALRVAAYPGGKGR